MRSLRLTLTFVLTVALTATMFVAVGATGAGAAEPILTDHAFSARGWSTRVIGGDVPARSGPTGLAILGCTRFGHVSHTNNTVAVELPTGDPSVHVGATETTVWSGKRGGTTSTNARNDVARVQIGDLQAEGLLLEQVRTRTRTWHDANGYHRLARVTVGSVTQYTGGVAVRRTDIPADQDLSGETLEIPGLVKLTFGIKSGTAGARKAVARAIGVKVELLPSSTTAVIGFAHSRIQGGATGGVLGGAVWGSKISGLDDVVNSGRTALRPVPCVGTRGRYIQNEVAEVTIPSVAQLGTVVSRVRGDQSDGSAYVKGISTIQRAAFGDRGLVITAIRGEGLVRRKADGSYVRHSNGTSLGRIRLNGESQAIPDPGETLTIPNVAHIKAHHVRKGTNKIRVTAVRVQLLQGSEVTSTVYLGNVALRVRRG
jgi:hypothetical protein